MYAHMDMMSPVGYSGIYACLHCTVFRQIRSLYHPQRSCEQMCVCVYIYIYVCVCVCVCVCIYLFIYKCILVCIYVCVCVYI
jgi:hypothetical protein